ncbi:hypothetical protein ACU4GD_20225 [Cupriavidus basilensis]
MIGRQTAHPVLLPLFIFLAGVGLNGAIFSMGGLAAMFYPTSGRSAGVAWMYGVGRIGGILGPIVPVACCCGPAAARVCSSRS